MFAGSAAAIIAAIAALGCGILWLRAECRVNAYRRIAGTIEERCAQAEAAADRARQAAAELRVTLDVVPMPIWRRACDGRLIDCNRAYARAFGISRETGLAEQGDLAASLRTLDGEYSASASSAHIVIDGERRSLQSHKVECADGQTLGFALDRTEIDDAKRELQRHVGAHAAVLEILTAAVAIFGPDKRLKFFNSAFEALWALERNWLEAGPSVDDILEHLRQSRRLPEYADFRAFKREHRALFISLIEPRHELMHLPDGRTLQLTISPHPLGGLIYIFDNVTDRLALECSYNTLAQVQRATLDHLFEGIAVYGGDGRLKLHNPAFRALWGLSDTDVAEEPHIAALVDKARHLLDDGGNWAARRDEMIAQVTSQSVASGLLYRRDGSVLQVASVPLPDGEVLLTYLDVSDTARIEQALRERNDALETTARLKSEFVANVSHELRTPLNTVTGFAEILHNQYFGPLNSSQSEYSAGILDCAHQLTALINDIIDLASIEANYLALEPTQVDVADMLQSLLLLTRERAHNRDLVIELDYPPQIGAILGDERRLKQALFNLVSNSVRFTPPGGAIRISAERTDDALLLHVSDHAPGFATTGAAEFFHLVPCSRSRSASSFGLSLVRRLIELHGGSVDIESIPARGTRITCRLPSGGTRGAGPEHLDLSNRAPDDSLYETAEYGAPSFNPS
jgi:signal transduction histidine kinase